MDMRVDAAGRQKLFAMKFPLAVGSEKVTPNLFFTGSVKIDTKTHKTTVAIKAFGPLPSGR